jgi:hypothetical protein
MPVFERTQKQRRQWDLGVALQSKEAAVGKKVIPSRTAANQAFEDKLKS